MFSNKTKKNRLEHLINLQAFQAFAGKNNACLLPRRIFLASGMGFVLDFGSDWKEIANKSHNPVPSSRRVCCRMLPFGATEQAPPMSLDLHALQGIPANRIVWGSAGQIPYRRPRHSNRSKNTRTTNVDMQCACHRTVLKAARVINLGVYLRSTEL